MYGQTAMFAAKVVDSREYRDPSGPKAFDVGELEPGDCVFLIVKPLPATLDISKLALNVLEVKPG